MIRSFLLWLLGCPDRQFVVIQLVPSRVPGNYPTVVEHVELYRARSDEVAIDEFLKIITDFEHQLIVCREVFRENVCSADPPSPHIEEEP